MSTTVTATAAAGNTGRKPHDGGGSIVLQYIDAIFDEPAAASPPPQSNGAPDDSRPLKVYESVIDEWIALVTEPSPMPPPNGRGNTIHSASASEPRRLAMAHSNTLLHLVLKSIALSLVSTSSSHHHVLPLPMPDVHVVAGLLDVLLDASLLTDDGFIARKGMLQSLGRFSLALFWIVKSPVAAQWIQRAVPRLASTKDSAVMIHMTFPFLRILADADAFVAINTTVAKVDQIRTKDDHRHTVHASPADVVAAATARTDEGLEDAWLAQLLVAALLQVATDQSEEKIKSQAMAILRRLLVVQMSGAKSSQKERVAMMLLPGVPNMLTLVHQLDGDDLPTSSSLDGLKRDLLLCIVATLQHVPEKQLKGYTLPELFWKPKALLPSTTYEVGYKYLGDEISRCESAQRHRHRDDMSDWQNEKLRAHVLRAIQTLRFVMDTFLGDGLPWQQVLSPDCTDQTKPPQLSLLDIEVYMKQRNNRRSQLTDEANTLSPRNGGGGICIVGNNGTASGTGTQSPGGPGSAHHRSLPRNWGKHYMAQRKNSMDTKPDDENGAASSDKAEIDMESHAKRLATAVARTLVTAIQTLIHEFSRSLGANQAFLATVVDLWYLLLTRIGHGHFDADVVSCVLAHLTAFLGRFQTPLFAHSNVLFMTDDAWCEQLVVLAASGAPTAPLAATFVCDLLATSFSQRGNFLRMEHALVRVVAKQLHLPLLPNLLDAMDTFPGVPPFRPRLTALVASLRRLVTTWQQYESAMTTLGTSWPTNDEVTTGQVESLTDALVAVAVAIPPEDDGLFDVHVKFIDALARVHITCGQFAEAAKCKLHLVDMASARGTGGGRRCGSPDDFILSQFKFALTYLSPQTTSTPWLLPEMALSIAQDMLAVCLKLQNFTEYAATLKLMDSVVAGVLAQQGGAKQDKDMPPVSRYFLVAIVGTAENVPDLGVEFIYKRSAFCHVSEMMASIESGLNACFPQLKVKPMSLAKVAADGGSVDDATTVYIKATPEEMIRCPIDTATDDIAKRTVSLLKIVHRDEKGLPHDIKAITHLLKGSINTEVNGGAPEVIQSFLAKGVVCVDKDANPMTPTAQTEKQTELRAALLQFLHVALTVLAISRDLFRRTNHRPTPSMGGMLPTTATNASTVIGASGSSNSHTIDDADALLLAPLQGEFEKAFRNIVVMLAATYDVEPDNVVALKAAAAFKLGLTL
ncbi:hypothetical protein DYB32_009377 [Aphanomyces invadans]|uniref:DOCKER Lobe C domain-containing protein n=1 Tax=Aphanomyces invadans TaxID=157072 RepID=A0A418AJ23_9STRA|nr:hypothetical protein DYB32_009377 [Aphanomyces invadans]